MPENFEPGDKIVPSYGWFGEEYKVVWRVIIGGRQAGVWTKRRRTQRDLRQQLRRMRRAVRRPAMTSRKMPLPKVRFVKEYGNWAGYRFRRYETPDGRAVEIRVRAGRGGLDGSGRHEVTNAEAKAEAAARLSGRPESGWEPRCHETQSTTSCLPVAPRCPRHGDPMRRRRGR